MWSVQTSLYQPTWVSTGLHIVHGESPCEKNSGKIAISPSWNLVACQSAVYPPSIVGYKLKLKRYDGLPIGLCWVIVIVNYIIWN